MHIYVIDFRYLLSLGFLMISRFNTFNVTSSEYSYTPLFQAKIHGFLPELPRCKYLSPVILPRSKNDFTAQMNKIKF